MKALRNPYVIGVLVVLAVVLVYYRFRTPPVVPQPPPEQPKRPSIAGPDASMELDQLGWIPSPARDPFRPAAARSAAVVSEQQAEPVADVLNLKAIWLQERGGWAVINGKILGEGDTILDFRVEKIQADGVLVQGPGGRRRVGFKPVAARPRPSVAGTASAVGKPPVKATPDNPVTVAHDSTATPGGANGPVKSGP